MFSAMSKLLSHKVRVNLPLYSPQIEGILAKSSNDKEITHSEFRHLTKAITSLYPERNTPPSNSPQAKNPQEQLFELHQYKSESQKQYFQRALALRDILSLSAPGASETLVVNFIDGLIDSLLTAIALEEKETFPGRITTLEEANFWIGEAKKTKKSKDRAVRQVTARLKACDENFMGMWYGKKGKGNRNWFVSLSERFR